VPAAALLLLLLDGPQAHLPVGTLLLQQLQHNSKQQC
jgi:hypothetical protein